MNDKKALSKFKKEKALRRRLKTKDWMQKYKQATGRNIDLGRNKNFTSTFGKIFLLIDCSGSMSGYQITQAKDGALGFAREAIEKGYSVGIIRFNSQAELIIEPTGQIKTLDDIIPRLTSDGSTNMSQAIDIAIKHLGRQFGEQIICIITDGMPDNREETLRLASIAKRRGIDIMTIGTDDADRDFLEQLATRKELSVKVEPTKLRREIVNMAKLLPKVRFQAKFDVA